jgi:hypothetical protein
MAPTQPEKPGGPGQSQTNLDHPAGTYPLQGRTQVIYFCFQPRQPHGRFRASQLWFCFFDKGRTPVEQICTNVGRLPGSLQFFPPILADCLQQAVSSGRFPILL